MEECLLFLYFVSVVITFSIGMFIYFGRYEKNYNGRPYCQVKRKHFDRDFFVILFMSFIPVFNLFVLFDAPKIYDWDKRIALLRLKPIIYFLPVVALFSVWLF